MTKKFNLRDFLMTYGFNVVFVLILLFLSLSTEHFFTYENIATVLANACPWIVMATGIVLVIMSGSIDISIGSILFIAIITTNIAMLTQDINNLVGTNIPLAFLSGLGISVGIGIPIILFIGILLGAFNGLLIVVIGINPWMATVGMMFVLRGLALWLTDARTQNIPPAMQEFGKIAYFKEFIIVISLAILLVMHLVVTRTKFGRQVMAIGNGEETASRLGVPTKRVRFATYVLSGLMVCAGGILQIFQIGNIHPRLGQGYEFTAIASIVVGGISLFGGEGKIFPGLLLGGLTMVIVENGLTHLGITPYAYPFVRGGIIFLAMYADAMKSRLLTRVHVMEEPELEEAKEGCE